MNISSIAERLGLKFAGNPNHEITRISTPENADAKSLCVIWDKNALADLDENIAIAAPEKLFTPDRDGIIVKNPRLIFASLLEMFSQVPAKPKGIHPSAVIAESAKVSPDAFVGACAYVGENCVVGAGTVIEPNATLIMNAELGENCLVHSGAVIGADGFGFERTADGLVKVPQIGGVVIGDDVEIGACTTIDRGTMGNTVIGSGTKIDNHVQVGHNVQIGRNCIICSMTGIAGSSIIEDNVTISVQAGITDHVRVGAGSILAGRTGVTNDIPAGSMMSGFPARNHNDAKRALVLMMDLPILYKRVHALEKWCKNHEA